MNDSTTNIKGCLHKIYSRLSITRILDKPNSIQPSIRLLLCRILFTSPFRAIPIETHIR